MSLVIENEVDVKFDFDYEKLITDVVNYALDYIKCPYESEVNVTLTNNEEIHKINKEFREIDRPTDVLSFPMIQYETPGDFDIVESCEDLYFNPDSGEMILGDIIISTDKVFSQAEEYGHSPKRELAFLVAHSMLHLFGFDHIDDEERKDMEKRQNEILDALGIYR
ncbi:rRNA maturation RNase YbeY [Lachnospiraceae bacterium HCP1S3_C3]|nr:rRNA maturation RNase YbeY [Lachnospiraceae bacterium]MDD6857673.1 rRNA maturation RNase YbeY [Lachnospiraceae bacterium]